MTTPINTPFALTLTADNAAAYELAEALGFSDVMEALSVSVFEVTASVSRVEALYATQAEAEAAKAVLSLTDDVDVTITQTPDEDWVSLSQAGLSPVRAGRFWVHGSHDADSIPSDISHPILIDAGMAFGTGHHGTTKGCLLIFEDLLNDGFKPMSVLDLGCGAGTLAIAAGMALPDLPVPVLATDIDQDAVDVTLENVALNKVVGKVMAARADGFDDLIFEGAEFDLIFANILAGPLMVLAPDIAYATAPGGRVILSGIIDDMAARVIEAFEAQGFTVTPQPSIEGWTSLLACKSEK